VVATTNLPMTPMVASTSGTQKEATVAAGPPAPPKVRTAQQAPARPRTNQYGYNPYGRQQSPFFFFFGR
jgi:hypothetical protein